MFTLAPAPMTKKSETQFCTYASVKIDDEINPLVRAAAALVGKSTQEFLSDVANEAAARVLKRDPIKRRPPEPRKPKS